ncbi:MAG: TetR/AcrR family transcriptional regulator [Acidobacteriia bacterium]|nr:TetR/AcrR family transcriptional regulator [Terriglobia bacterium]
MRDNARTGVTERRAREREALSEAILDAASELIVKEGPGSLSIRKIAEKIEYAPSTIYLYFEDKHAILAGICIRFFEDLLEELNEIRDNTPAPPRSPARRSPVLRRFRPCQPDPLPGHFPDRSRPRPFPEHPICVAIPQGGFTTLGSLGEAIGAAMRAGVVEPGDPELKAFTAWLSLHGLTAGIITMAQFDQTGWPNQNLLIDQHVEMVMRGLGAKPQTA